MPKTPAQSRPSRPADHRGELAGEDPLFLPPLRPSRRLFVAGAGLLAAWVGFLFYLYFTTILPAQGQQKRLIDPSALRAAPTQPGISVPR
jgi:hypothetical protein